MVNGNLAYKNEYISPRIKPAGRNSRQHNNNPYGRYAARSYAAGAAYYTSRQQTVKKPVHIEQSVNTFEKEKKQMVHRKITLRRIVYMSIVVLSAFFMISKFVAVNETAGEIKALTNELESTRAYTSQRVFEMERNIDLSEVEEIATSELGMQRPESYQIIYVNVDKDDVSEVTAADVEGAGNHLKAFFGKVKENIIELFSIN